MSLRLELKEEVAATFRGVVAKTCTDLRDKIKSLSIELRENEELLKQLGGAPETQNIFREGITTYGAAANTVQVDKANIDENPTEPDYKKDWTWENKIKYILEENGQPLNTTDIVKRVMEIEPYLNERSRIVASVSATLSIKTKKGVFANVGKNHRNEALFDLYENKPSTAEEDFKDIKF